MNPARTLRLMILLLLLLIRTDNVRDILMRCVMNVNGYACGAGMRGIKSSLRPNGFSCGRDGDAQGLADHII